MMGGCAAKTRYIEVRPQCEPPAQPALPKIQGDELRALTDEVYFRLERREKRLTDWALEMRAMLEQLCAHPEAPEG